jgi:hypothetical protein
MTVVRKPQGRKHFENVSIGWTILLKRTVEKFLVCGSMKWMEMARIRLRERCHEAQDLGLLVI